MDKMDIAQVNKLEQMLTIKEVSQLLHVYPGTLRRWSNNGLIKSYRITPRGDRRFRKDDVYSFLIQFTENGGDPNKCFP